MHDDADLLVRNSPVPEALSGQAGLLIGLAKNVVVIDVGQAGESEADEGPAEDEEEHEVVAFLEAERVVDLADDGDEGVGGWRGGGFLGLSGRRG